MAGNSSVVALNVAWWERDQSASVVLCCLYCCRMWCWTYGRETYCLQGEIQV